MTPPPDPRTPRSRRRLRWVTALAILAAFVAGLILYIPNAADSLAARVRARGQPVDFADLAKLFPANHAARSNLLELEGACNRLTRIPASLDAWYDNPATNGLAAFDPQTANEARAWVAANEQTRVEIQRWVGTALDTGFEFDPNVPFSNRFHERLRSASGPHWRPLRLETTRSLLAAEEGDPDAAVEALHRAVEFWRIDGDDLVMFGVYLHLIEVQALERTAIVLLNRGRLRSSHLERMQRDMEALARSRTFRDSMRFRYAYLNGFRQYPRQLKQLIGTPVARGPAERALCAIYNSSGLGSAEFSRLLELADLGAEALAPPHPERKRLVAAFETRRLPMTFVPQTRFTEEARSSISFLVSREEKHRCRWAALRAAVAVERFRARHGRLPGALPDLVPDFLPSVPIDPIDQQAIRFHSDAGGFVVYSIGLDETDDHGVPASDDSGNDNAGDEAVRVDINAGAGR